VFQSYRTSDVPVWIERCLQTVRAWAASCGFDYGFIDDQLFGYVPAWYMQKVGGNILLVSDLARLRLAKELHSRGYDRTVWVDADVVVFDPECFTIDITEEYAFCQEVWVGLGQQGELVCSKGVNNAVSVFMNVNSFLDFYIDSCLKIVCHKPRLNRLDASTHFLTALHDLVPFHLMTDVGLFSPLIMADIVRGAEGSLRAYMAHFDAPLRAANLCSSFRGSHHDGILMDDGVYEAVVDRLLLTRGQIINKFR
jgi:hypothetical protein